MIWLAEHHWAVGVVLAALCLVLLPVVGWLARGIALDVAEIAAEAAREAVAREEVMGACGPGSSTSGRPS